MSINIILSLGSYKRKKTGYYVIHNQIHTKAFLLIFQNLCPSVTRQRNALYHEFYIECWFTGQFTQSSYTIGV